MAKKIDITNYVYTSPKVTDDFNGYKIVLLSDLHCKEIGFDNSILIEEINRIKPDSIMVAGDMLVDNGRKMDVSERLFEKLAKKYDIYYACGNHELKLGINPKTSKRYKEYRSYLRSLGVNYLNNKTVIIKRGNSAIKVNGINIKKKYYNKIWNKVKMHNEYPGELLGGSHNDMLEILLAHNPEYFKAYAGWGADIVMSGHVHGGIMVLPFIGGVIAPSLRLFPYYDFGEFHEDDSVMYLSRGLGAHTIPLRIFNRPEIVTITLENNS